MARSLIPALIAAALARPRFRSEAGFRAGKAGKGTSRAGFTLVEVLVVSLIVAILAGVAVPMYSGYIKSQKRQAALAVAQTAAVTAASFMRRTGVAPTTNELKDALSLPSPQQFEVSVEDCGGNNCVRVIEKSTADTAISYAKF